MNPDAGSPVPALVRWLVELDHEVAPGWEPEPGRDALRCNPELVARLTEIARPIGTTRRRFVAGCPVIQHPNGEPIAAAAETAWLAVRSAMAPGALEPAIAAPTLLESEWVVLDPWAANSAFARAVDLLRAHVARAYERAEAGVGA